MRPIVDLYNLGKTSYLRALNAQQILFDKLKNSIASDGRVGNSLILVEHEPVYTVGIRSSNYNIDYVSRLKERLINYRLEAEFVKTNRGGLITFHGPGQLVAYPIIRLNDFQRIPNKSVKAYVNRLESTIIHTLNRVGLRDAHTMEEYPGVWLGEGDRKIAFIGIACKRYITMHGISINCDCDLSWFDHIVSCGIEGKSITSIRQEFESARHSQRGEYICPNHSTQDIAQLFCSSFSELFDCDLKDGDVHLECHSEKVINKYTIA